MDLQLPAGMEPLPCLRKALAMWSEDITEFVDEILRKSLENSLDSFFESKVGDIRINGRPISDLLIHARLKELVAPITLVIYAADDATAVLQDVVSILCLMGAMCGDLKGYFQGNDAEETWRKLLSDANMILEEVASSYERNKHLYAKIFKSLSRLLPTKLGFCIGVAASIVCALWHHRDQIALWIAANWEAVAIGIWLFIFGYIFYYLLTSGSGDKGNRKRFR